MDKNIFYVTTLKTKDTKHWEYTINEAVNDQVNSTWKLEAMVEDWKIAIEKNLKLQHLHNTTQQPTR